jgi:hypothetical protein
MGLTTGLRGFRAAAAMSAALVLAVTPAAADAKAKPKAGHHKAPTAKAVNAPTGLGTTFNLSSAMQLAAMKTAIAASPAFWAGLSSGCDSVTPLFVSQRGDVIAGNFRNPDGSCYVWLNLQQSSLMTGSEICKTTLHEMGHLNGLQHSSDPTSVMYAPFRSDPMPAPCASAGH